MAVAMTKLEPWVRIWLIGYANPEEENEAESEFRPEVKTETTRKSDNPKVEDNRQNPEKSRVNTQVVSRYITG